MKEGGTLVGCSCSFTGSDPSRENHISPERSLAAQLGEIRPDADILGIFDEKKASESSYMVDANGRLQNPSMNRLVEPEEPEQDAFASIDALEEQMSDLDNHLDNLDDMFADDYADT